MISENWLELAKTRQDDRPIFNRTEHTAGLSIAGDGFCFHITENDREEYVDWKSVLQKVKPISKGITVVFDPKYLINALTDLDNTAVLHVSGRDELIEISGTVSQTHSNEKTKCYAVISPIHNQRNPTELWRPIDIEFDSPESEQENQEPSEDEYRDLTDALEAMLLQFGDIADAKMTLGERSAVALAELALGREVS